MRTFSEAIANTPNVNAEIKIPVTIVIIIDVCLGLRPKMDIRRLPIFVPNLSPMKAMAPPMIAIIKIIFKPTNMSSALLSVL